MKKTWFITGASRGFGRIWAEAPLQRGDEVAATARNLADVAGLKGRFGDAALPLALDLTRTEQVQQVSQQAYGHFGRLDVVVNNDGVGLLAAAEETSDKQVRDLFDANYFGMVRVLRAAPPLLRQQGSGHILGGSSGLGITSMPLPGFCCATKRAVEALQEALAQEVRPFGIRVTLVEPAACATDFGKSAKNADAPEPYADFRRQLMTHLGTMDRGDLQATPEAILKLVDAEDRRCGWGSARPFSRGRGLRMRAHCHVGGVGGRRAGSTGRASEETRPAVSSRDWPSRRDLTPRLTRSKRCRLA
ncbi:MAG TPA: SDR family NAD(P)-dependent oxidoreductase [Acidobacteriaceae bacterium]|nr:SDR family NAD(P)-dependent oxidoreductase [Acidobacteriaceae bacterium]